ncbi:MAG: 30S ribosomal protein S16 [Chitinispirillales bacterium]|nr:30S ribosomal protein S16 [Chitinispirillales bacterium]
MVSIRLARGGKKKKPFYRIVAADSRAPRDGRFLEVLGYYNPVVAPKDLKINLERVDYWISVGAKMSQTVENLRKSAIEKK